MSDPATDPATDPTPEKKAHSTPDSKFDSATMSEKLPLNFDKPAKERQNVRGSLGPSCDWSEVKSQISHLAKLLDPVNPKLDLSCVRPRRGAGARQILSANQRMQLDHSISKMRAELHLDPNSFEVRQSPAPVPPQFSEQLSELSSTL